MSIPDTLKTSLADKYRIERELGMGGMATVYLAHDVRHERDVAVKVLHPDLGAALGAERFLAEIKTTARLQHPHILPLLDSGEASGLLYYVMPLVEGETLRARLERERQLPLDETLRIATETASALDYAHRHGVIHRDIKPENILIHDGRAVVADFGIALAVSAASGVRMTQTGLSLGTPQYMSPEQAMGERTIDARTDIYALGAITYEMLTGEPPFSGATVQAIVAKVLTERPTPPTAVRDTVPRHVEAAVLKALAKLPADRFASAAQFAEALARPELMPQTGASVAQLQPLRRSGVARYLSASPLVWAALAISMAATVYALLRREAPRPLPPVTKVHFPLPGGVSIGLGPTMTISLDGSRIAFTGTDSARTRRVYVRPMDRLEAAPVPGTEDGSSPFFSPDGENIGFTQAGKLRTVPLRGGAVTTVAELPGASGGATWGADSTIVFATGGSLYRVKASGGVVTLLLKARAGARLLRPSFLPGSHAVLAQLSSSDAGLYRGVDAAIAIRLGDTSYTQLLSDAQFPQYVDGGVLVYGSLSGQIVAAPFDLASLRILGPGEPITDDVVVGGGGGAAKFAVSRNGTLAYPAYYRTAGRDLLILDRSGIARVLPIGQRFYRYPRFSPDGRFLAFHIELRGTVRGDIWRYSLADNALLRLTVDSSSGQPEWDPDGKSLVYAHSVGTGPLELYRIGADGGDTPHPLIATGFNIYESRITPDRRTIVFRQDNNALNRDIMMAPLDSPKAVRPLVATAFDEKGIALSPDGKWLAYVSNETGIHEVYIRRLEGNNARWPVSHGGGREPRWIRTGELFFRKEDSVMVTRVDIGTEPRVSAPRLLFTGKFASTGFEALWDVSPDGLRFAFVRGVSSSETPVGLLLNWADEWRARHKR